MNNDCWIILGNEVYDVTDMINKFDKQSYFEYCGKNNEDVLLKDRSLIIGEGIFIGRLEH
jgi:hypothetical protein